MRGLSVFGPPAAADVLRQAVAPLADLGVVGAIASKPRRPGGTDSTSFNAAGLPGIGSAQDPIEYQSYTWHTNLDTYERVIEDDVQKAAIVVATTVYALAMRDEPLPRFSDRRDAEAGGACAARPQRTRTQRTYRTYRTRRTLTGVLPAFPGSSANPRKRRYTDLTRPKHRHVTGSVRFPQCHGDHTFDRCLRGACDVWNRNHACRAVARGPHPLGRGNAG